MVCIEKIKLMEREKDNEALRKRWNNEWRMTRKDLLCTFLYAWFYWFYDFKCGLKILDYCNNIFGNYVDGKLKKFKI